MNRFDHIKNIVGGAMITAVCVFAIFSIRAIFGTDSPPETLEDNASVFVMCYITVILSLFGLTGLLMSAQHLYMMHAEKTGLENHSKGLTAFGTASALVTLLLQLVFWSAFVVMGLIAAVPSLFPFDAVVEGGEAMSVIGWTFVAAAVGAMIHSVISAVKAIKKAKLSYSFEEYALPPEEMYPEQSVSLGSENETQNETFGEADVNDRSGQDMS